MPDYAERISRARERMERLGIDLLYLPPGANAYYLSGWRRRAPSYGNTNRPGGWVEGLLLGLDKGPVFAVPRMVADFWLVHSPGMDVRVLPDLADPVAFLADLLGEFGPRRGAVAVENRAWAELVLGLRRAGLADAELRLASDVLAELRMAKTDEELALLRRAGEVVDRTMADVVGFLRPGSGQTELDVAWEVDRLMVQHGADGPSFTTNAWQMGPGEDRALSLKTSRRPLERGNSLCFDFGCVLDEYCYDFGRAVFLGEPTPEYREAYDLVMNAARVGIAALRTGQHTAEQVDALARRVIADAGYGKWFGHRLGHSIGLDVHEPPYLDKGDTTVLRQGMCFTVEPSIFIPGQFGARTEDVVVVGPEGGTLLTSYRRDLQAIG